MALTEASAFKDGSIVNDDVKSDAAIAGSKIDGSSFTTNITTTQNLQGAGVNISGTIPVVNFTDTDGNPDYRIQVNAGSFLLRDQTNDVTRVTITSDGTTTFANNVNCNSGVDITGNITVTGTVDGRDIATDGTKLDTLSVPITPEVVTTQLSNDVSTTNSSFQNAITLAINPNSTSSSLLITAGGLTDGDFAAGEDGAPNELSFIEVQLFRGSTALGTSFQPSTSGFAGFYIAFKDTNNHGGNSVTYHLKFKRRVTPNTAGAVKIERASSLVIQEII
tara:strand:+ start:155 stop:988 length:834 start_codon:yes stop_codon:yes gene_type:complete